MAARSIHLVPLTPQVADSLAAEFAGEMAERWRRGERPITEEYLSRCPELGEHPQAAADLIYEEYCLHREHGHHLAIAEVLNRFPQWRSQLEVMFDCQQLLDPRRSAPQFPSAGDSLEDFHLMAELGRGVQGPVFLARQQSLNRPVVLKLTAYDATEHLSLARLQHTHIVPLFSVHDFPDRGFRALCMPYFAGVTLAELFDRLRRIPPWRRTACDWRDVLARAQSESPFAAPASNQARTALPNHYPDIVCRIGICLADAAQYAHDRGLLHLDIKPSNVLIAADGLPMLLDFHLARGRLLEGDAAPAWFGGTPGYMSPEQASAFRAAHNGQLIPQSIDERSDLYSLGVVLYEMLAGTVRADAEAAAPTVRIGQESNALAERAPWRPVRLTQLNPQVSVGLADIIHKCLAQNPAERYPNMAALGADLRRHLANVPLRGVRNRSLAERWRKWRRRRPHGMALAAMMLLMLMVVGALAVGAMRHIADRVDQAEAALVQAQEQLGRRDWQAASATLHRGLAAVRGLPGTWSVAGELQQSLQIATAGWQHEDRSAATQELHALAERARGLYGATNLPAGMRDDLAANCGDFWHRKAEVAERLQPLTPPIRADLVDLAVFWANLQNLMSTPSESPVAILSDAERLFGSCSVLSTERRLHGASAEDSVAEAADGPIAWQHFALARAYLRAGDLQRASDEANQALRAEPQGMWPNFYFGLCAQARRHHSEAVAAFGVCIGASPQSGACFCNRGIAFAALGLTDAALRDFDQALRLDPTLATAALERARLQVRAGRFTEALADFERAAALGADAALSPPEAAIVYYERGDITAALGALFQKHKANLNLSNSAPPFSAKSR